MGPGEPRVFYSTTIFLLPTDGYFSHYHSNHLLILTNSHQNISKTLKTADLGKQNHHICTWLRKRPRAHPEFTSLSQTTTIHHCSSCLSYLHHTQSRVTSVPCTLLQHWGNQLLSLPWFLQDSPNGHSCSHLVPVHSILQTVTRVIFWAHEWDHVTLIMQLSNLRISPEWCGSCLTFWPQLLPSARCLLDSSLFLEKMMSSLITNQRPSQTWFPLDLQNSAEMLLPEKELHWQSHI